MNNLTWLEGSFVPQSMQFMIDLLPTIRKLTADWPAKQPMTVLDVGAGSGAGANLLATLYRDCWFGFPMKVDALDQMDLYKDYAEETFRDIRYMVGQCFELVGKWDLVICSHVLEHNIYPMALVEEVMEKTRHWALFYAPYEEKPLPPCHVNAIDHIFVEKLHPLCGEIVHSPAYATDCIAFALKNTT